MPSEELPPPGGTPPLTSNAVGPISGTRLAVQFVESADGSARRFHQLIDREIDQPCFLPYVIGDQPSIPCRPRAMGQPVFLDAACTQRAVETAEGDAVWVSGFDVIRLGARLDPQPAQRYIEYSPGRCAAMPDPPAAPVYAIAEVIDASRLPSGRLIEDASDPRLLLRIFEGDDGSRVLYQINDRLAGPECLPEMTREGLRCAPDTSDTLNDEGLLDTDCNRLAILEYSFHLVARVVGRNDEVYRFEIPDHAVDPEVGIRGEDGQCRVETRQAGRKTLHLGVPYPERDWAPIEAQNTGTSALSARVAVLANRMRGEPARTTSRTAIFETDGKPCSPLWIGDSLRCAPAIEANYLWWSAAFADGRCSERVIGMSNDADPPAEISIYDQLGADQLYRGGVYSVGEQVISRGVYRLDFAGRCYQMPDSAGERHFYVGAALPASRFPELRLSTAP